MRIRLALSSITTPRGTRRGRRARAASGWDAQARGGIETAHGVTGGGAIGGADARVLVRVGGDVGDKFLRSEGEETREVRRGLVRAVAGGREPGEGEIMSCNGVGNLEHISI